MAVKKAKQTGKTLVIVESPNKIKKISSYLGQNYIIRASFGHVIDLSTGDKVHRLGVDLDTYEPKYKIIPDKKDKIQSIIDASTEADQIYLATDPDREGEAIAWHLQTCLESSGKPIYRISFNEITKPAITKAIQSPGPLDKNLFDAQQARRVLDRIVGFLASDFLRQAMGPNLSAGRVQSVATKLVVDREIEIENFKPEEYWNITAGLAKSITDDSFIAKYDKKVTNSTDALAIKTDLDKDTYIVDKVDKKEKKRNPLPPLTTSTLQQAVSTRYGFSVSKTMKAAQSLYEAGLITYMRTDSTRIAPEAITSVRDYLKQNGLGHPSTPNNYSTKKGQDAHEAIRPTDVLKKPQNLFVVDDQQKVYRVIWERFVACQMEAALYDTVSVVVKSSSGHNLKASGRTLKYEGWLKIASDQKSQPGESESMLPPLNQGDALVLVPPNVKTEQKFTQPPPRYGEAALVKELEKRGIGRPSTFASILETIKGRNYVEMKGKVYQATDIGKQVIAKLTDSYKFMDYNYTSEMESKLDDIAEGNLTYTNMLNDFFIPFKEECRVAETLFAPDYGIPCPECGKKMLLKHGMYGFYMKCVDAPNCKGTHSVDMVDGKPIVKEPFKKKIIDNVDCPKCKKKGMVLNETGKFGPFYHCQDYPKCKGTRKIPYGKKCIKCGHEMFMTVFSGEKKLACMGYFEPHNCKNVENLPSQDKSGWVDPTEYRSSKTKKSSIQKIISKEKSKNSKAAKVKKESK